MVEICSCNTRFINPKGENVSHNYYRFMRERFDEIEKAFNVFNRNATSLAPRKGLDKEELKTMQNLSNRLLSTIEDFRFYLIQMNNKYTGER